MYDCCTHYPTRALFICSIMIRMGIYIHSVQAFSYSYLDLEEIDISTSVINTNLDENRVQTQNCPKSELYLPKDSPIYVHFWELVYPLVAIFSS